MDLLHVFAQNVRYYRLQLGLSQEELASLSGLYRTYISAIERERRNISLGNIQSIAQALHVEAYQLLLPSQSRSYERIHI